MRRAIRPRAHGFARTSDIRALDHTEVRTAAVRQPQHSAEKLYGFASIRESRLKKMPVHRPERAQHAIVDAKLSINLW